MIGFYVQIYRRETNSKRNSKGVITISLNLERRKLTFCNHEVGKKKNLG